MNVTASNQKFIAFAIIIFCAIAVVLGLFQLATNPTVFKEVGKKESLTGTFLGGSGSRLAYITLNGVITGDSEGSSLISEESAAMKARKLLYYAAKDPNVKGVLLRINSPGGTVGTSQELYEAVSTVRKEKPIVVSMGDLAASGGYYTASAADKIVADPGTLTGSIGVIIHSMNVKGLLTDKLGVKSVTIKSGKFKDILSPFRPPTDTELSMLQHIIDTSYHQFLHAVLVGRTRDLTDTKLKAQRIKQITAIADGRVVLGSDALKIGLVDQLGGLEDAKKLLQQMAAKRFNIQNPDQLTLQEYETTFNLFNFLGINSLISLHPQADMQELDPEQVLMTSIRYSNQPLWLMESIH